MSGITAPLPTEKPGDTKFVAGNVAPVGWLAMNGASLSRAAYPALFAAIGVVFGSVDAASFTLPDMRGEFMRGFDGGRGVDSGRVFGSAQSDSFQAHGHNTTASTGAGDVTAMSPTAATGSRYDPATGYLTDGANGVPRTGSETRPRNLAFLAVIKY